MTILNYNSLLIKLEFSTVLAFHSCSFRGFGPIHCIIATLNYYIIRTRVCQQLFHKSVFLSKLLNKFIRYQCQSICRCNRTSFSSFTVIKYFFDIFWRIIASSHLNQCTCNQSDHIIKETASFYE